MYSQRILDLARGIIEGEITVAIFDLDKTLWTHEDVSSMHPPFRKIDKYKVVDSRGDIIVLYHCVEDLLKFLREKNLKIAVASWNIFDKAYQALQTFDLTEYFDYFVIEFHPHKEEMIEKIKRKFNVDVSKMIFFDDNPEIIDRVLRFHSDINIVQIGKDIDNICDFYDILVKVL